MTNTLGLDFGTSNSAAGVLVGDRPHLIALEPGEQTMPTSVFFDFEARKMLYGSPANRALIDGETGRYMRALKSILGTPLLHEERRLMGERLDFVAIIGRFLNMVKIRAEAACFTEFDTALSGRPVRFHDDAEKDRQAEEDLRACYRVAGFSDVQFMYEPEAAARANAAHLKPGELGFTVDIGGGTSDFTLFQMGQAGEIEILASHGTRVGGTDFDRKLSIDHVMPLLGLGSAIRNEFGPGSLPAPKTLFHDLATWQKIPFLYAPEHRRAAETLRRSADQPALLARLCSVLQEELGHDLAFAVERGKIAANTTGQADARINLGIVEKGLGAALGSGDLEESLAALIDKITAAAEETLRGAGVSANQVASVIYVGGSSLMQVVKAAMTALMPEAKPQDTAALTAVADGLAIASATAFR